MIKKILLTSHIFWILTIVFLCLNHGLIYGQESDLNVSGRVIDESGSTLPGVTVTIKGTSEGTVTDIDGKFTLKVNSPDDIFVFSFIGFEKIERSAAFEEEMVITMQEEVQSIDEVVVVGYGTQEKKTVTGSITSIESKDIVDVPTSNLSTAITGKLPGVVTMQTSGRPGEDAASIFIRGRSTWANTSPLIIVDGVERNSFSQIDPNEVESISVLKDASATAVYGVKGANGVILITTKRGKEGKTSINFSANLGGQKPTNIPKFLNSYDHLKLRKIATLNDGKDPANDPLLSDKSLEGYREGEDPYKYPNVNWYDEVVKPMALQQKYNMNVRGGTDKVRYFISLGYMDQGGMFKYTDTHERYTSDTYFRRFNFRSNIDLDINKYQTLSANISGRTEEQNGFPDMGNIMQTLIAQVPYRIPIYNPDGTYAATQGVHNPIAKIAVSGYDNTRTKNYDIVGNLANDLGVITKGLKFDMNLSFNSSMGTRKSYREGPDTYFYNPNTEQYDQVTESNPFRYAGQSSTSAFKRVGIQLKLYHSRKFNKSKISTTLVYNQDNEQYGSSKPFILMGYAGRIEYDYDSKYLAEFNIGYNGSENFAPGNKFGLFPAFSAGYVLSEEPFMAGTSHILPFFKIRGSAGLVGNDQIGGERFLWQGMYTQVPPVNPYLQYFAFGTTNPSSRGGIYEERSENRALTWETALKTNLGIDTRLFDDNLLNITFDAFKEEREDILMSARSLLNTTGIPSPEYNIGVVHNRGYEIKVTHRNQINEVGYAVKANYSFSRNEIKNYDDPAGTPSWQKYEGYPIGQFRGYEALGFFESKEEINISPDQSTLGGPIIPGDLKYRDVNEDGQIDGNDKKPIGYSRIPEVSFSVTPEISWNNFRLTAMLQGAANASIFFSSNAGFEFGGAAGGGQVTKQHQDYWSEDNKDASYPALHLKPQHSNKTLNSFHLKSGDYLRLRNVQLSYALPEHICNALNLSDVNFSLSGNNVKTWSHIENFDPEMVEEDGEVYPQQSIYSLGVNVNF